MEKLERIEEFFKYDLEIKKMLHDLVPNFIDGYDQDYIFKYSDRIFKDLKVIKYYIVRIMNSFSIKNTEFIDEIFKKYEISLAEAGNDFNKINSFYKSNLSDMSPKFIDNINRNCVGYTFEKSNLINEARTVNEILHFLHHYIINNEEFYMSIPKISEKTNYEGEDIILRGVENKISKNYLNVFHMNYH